MALLSSSHPSSLGRAVEKDALCYSLEKAMLSFESARQTRLPSSFASLRRSGQDGVRRGIIRDAATPGLRALQGGARPPRRLVDFVRAIPKISRAYFRSPFRRALYGAISVLGGFFVAHAVSLSFGALGLNDVVAAAFSLLCTEYITKYYHTRPQMTFTVALTNNFKIGFTLSLFIDAFKIAS